MNIFQLVGCLQIVFRDFFSLSTHNILCSLSSRSWDSISILFYLRSSQCQKSLISKATWVLIEHALVQRLRSTTPRSIFLTHKHNFSSGKCVCREWANMVLITAEMPLWSVLSADQRKPAFTERHCWSEWSCKLIILVFRCVRKHSNSVQGLSEGHTP